MGWFLGGETMGGMFFRYALMELIIARFLRALILASDGKKLLVPVDDDMFLIEVTKK